LRNRNGDLPIRNLENKKIAYVKLGDDAGNHFVNMMKNYAKVDVVSDKNLDGLLNKLKPYNLVIIGFHKSNLHPWKSYKFKQTELVWLQEIAREKNVILDVFASPYSLLQLKTFVNIEGLLVSYQNSKLAQSGLATTNLSRFEYTIPEAVKVSSEKLQKIDSIATVILEEKMAPGFQIVVAREGKVILQKSYGHHTNKLQRKVKNLDVYDVASLTKILASLPLLMKAEETHKISLNTPLADLLPSFKGSNKDTILIKEILSHTARLKAWIPFYLKTQDSITGLNSSQFYSRYKSKKYSVKVAQDLYLTKTYKDSIFKYIKEADQRKRTGYKYSDLGYYLFKEILEKEYQKPLNKLAEELFYKPLGANRTSYLPLKKFSKSQIIPTEKDAYYRNQLLHGYVHDMGAAMLGGVGGHAGLFANANDVAKIMQMYLQKGFYGGKRYVQSATVEKFNQRYFSAQKVRRGLGFDKPQLNKDIKATCGCVSDESFGHSGFTGTYTWADPKSGLVYVFLSNRVYPTMENRGLVKNNIRTEIQQIIQDALLD